MTWNPDTPAEFRDAIVTGDARLLAARLPDASVDLVFTDPPYSRDVLHLYGWLAREAARVLKPGGFCFALCGLSHLAELMAMMSAHLDYFWTLCEFQPGSNSPFNPRRIVCKWRPILAFTKGFEPKVCRWLVDGRATVRDKRFHEWGQSPDFASMCIGAHSKPGDVVLEPFCGGATTVAVCKQLGRHFIAFEICEETAARARERVRNTLPPLPLEWAPESQTALEFAP